MKKQNKTKQGKFVDFHEFNQNKLNKKNSANDSFNIIDGKYVKEYEVYETPLESLAKSFPNFSIDVIESIYEENNRTYHKTKQILEELSCDKSEKDSFDSSIKENSTINKKKKKQTELDLTSLARFKLDDPFVEKLPKYDNSKNLTEIKKLKEEKRVLDSNNEARKNNKIENEYVSIFTTLSNELTPKNENKITNCDNQLEYVFFNDCFENLFEFFPNLTKTEIIEKLCENDFDVDKMIYSILDENETKHDYLKLESQEISKDFQEEVLSNFYKDKNTFDKNNYNILKDAIFTHNIQNEIEKKNKQENLSYKNSLIYSEKEFPSIYKSELRENQNIEEYFLDKDINQIKNKEIREDLIKLSKIFAFTDEEIIKWVYFQFMDYRETFRYLKKSQKHKGIFDREEKIKFIDKNPITENKSSSIENLGNKNEIFFRKIISENPNNWNIETNFDKINLSEYQSMRNKLIHQAHVAWRSGRPQDAKIIMAKARRYKQEINELLMKKKIKLFSKNNENLDYIFSKSENFLDLHGLNFEESKIILNKKFYDIKNARLRGELESSKKLTLNIITGAGHHSLNKNSVLFPKLLEYISDQSLPHKSDTFNGSIIVYL